jgi:hypothetical protein
LEFEPAYFHVILFQEVNDSDVVFESHLVGRWESVKSWHIASICLDRLENVFRQADRVEFEIGLE